MRFGPTPTFIAFVGDRCIAAGPLGVVLAAAKHWLDGGDDRSPLIFSEHSGAQVDFDFRGSLEEVLARASPPAAATGRGRPKLGVVSREITLLPRHWEWLEAQPSGCSAVLRRLIDADMKRAPERLEARRARDATGKIMTVLAGNRAHFEEAMRSLYSGEPRRFADQIGGWPEDVRMTLERLAKPWFDLQEGGGQVVTNRSARGHRQG